MIPAKLESAYLFHAHFGPIAWAKIHFTQDRLEA